MIVKLHEVRIVIEGIGKKFICKNEIIDIICKGNDSIMIVYKDDSVVEWYGKIIMKKSIKVSEIVLK